MAKAINYPAFKDMFIFFLYEAKRDRIDRLEGMSIIHSLLFSPIT